MLVLGVSGLYHDASVALVRSGKVLFAAHEERYTRRRHDPALPTEAIEACFAATGTSPKDLAAIAFYEKPAIKFLERFLVSTLATWPRSLSTFLEAVPSWMGEKLWVQYDLARMGHFRAPVRYYLHHDSHAASAFYPSGFDDAAIVTIDGVGEWSCTTIGYGRGKDFVLTQEQRFPHSLGLLYSTLTAFLGFKVNSSEYKVMGLAPYGEPTLVDKFHELVDLKEDGSLRLRMKYFQFHRSLTMPTPEMAKLFGHPQRAGEDEPITQFHKDCARSLQEFLNIAMLRVAQRAYDSYPSKNLVLAGGVALNCVANSYIKKHGPFENVWVQPAAGDAGGALGCALLASREIDPSFAREEMTRADLGTEYAESDIDAALRDAGLDAEVLEREALLSFTAERIANGGIIGWFQGRMEFGPRALGYRSILADPRKAENQARVNMAIKFRESFRPFAPSVPEDSVSDWFDWKGPSRFMLFTAQTRRPEALPAVTHLDGSARIQTVSRDTNPLYYDLHRAFERATGVPVLINTSFNVRGEPIVCSPADAIRCFLGTDLDLLVLGHRVVRKERVKAELIAKDHRHEFAPD